ncbi:CDP-alcohol phosphatidyltransferase family protein [Denitromonas sp.]|uniref:CDP-alcohol phosphatidyltransferase family protein n=1 Tax=Denitromonas sp. TaxID=2734609 RepID=UPI003A83B638
MFSNPHSKPEAIKHNPLNRFLYDFSYPFAKFFASLGCTPNHLTWLSNFSAVISAIALAWKAPAWVFIISWLSSVVLDFSDGTVARMIGKRSKNAFRFDHMSDLAKISIVLISAGLYHNTKYTWLLCSAALFSFMYYSILNHELKAANSSINSALLVENPNTFLNELKANKILLTAYTTLGCINGHTLLILLALPFGPTPVSIALVYLILVSLFGSALRIRRLMSLPKP